MSHLIELAEDLRKTLTKFMCRNRRYPIEIGCHENVLQEMGICQHCRKYIGDEFHYLYYADLSPFSQEKKQYPHPRY